MELADDVKDLLHQDGGQAHGGLVQHQQPGVAHQRPADGQHLLLAAGEGAGDLPPTLLQSGELGIDLFQVCIHTGGALGISAHFQVFFHAHLQEDAPAFRHLSQALFHDLVAGHVGNIFAAELDAACAGAQQAGDGLQGGGLAGAVGTDQSDHLALIHMEGNAFDGVDGAVIDVHVFNFQNLHAQASFFLPR